MLSEVRDVEVRFFRELTDEEKTLVEARLQDVESKIRVRIPNLDSRLVSEPGLEGIVRRVAADAVIRLVRNPEGYVQETDGNYTYMLAQSHADGRLTILADEWEDLGLSRTASIVHVELDLPWERW